MESYARLECNASSRTCCFATAQEGAEWLNECEKWRSRSGATGAQRDTTRWERWSEEQGKMEGNGGSKDTLGQRRPVQFDAPARASRNKRA